MSARIPGRSLLEHVDYSTEPDEDMSSYDACIHWMRHYFLDPDPDQIETRIATMIDGYEQAAGNARVDSTVCSGFAAWISMAMADHPDRTEAWLDTWDEHAVSAIEMLLLALWITGREELMGRYEQTHPALVRVCRDADPPDLHHAPFGERPQSRDLLGMLVNAWFYSGDDVWLDRLMGVVVEYDTHAVKGRARGKLEPVFHDIMGVLQNLMFEHPDLDEAIQDYLQRHPKAQRSFDARRGPTP